MRRLRRPRRELRTVSSARGRKPWNHAPLQVTTRHHILCAGSTGGGAEALSNRIPAADEPAKNRPPGGKTPRRPLWCEMASGLHSRYFLGACTFSQTVVVTTILPSLVAGPGSLTIVILRPSILICRTAARAAISLCVASKKYVSLLPSSLYVRAYAFIVLNSSMRC